MEWSDKPLISNGWLIAGLILFFPIGLLLLLIRIMLHYNLKVQKSADMKAGGVILLVFFLFYVIFVPLATSSDPETQQGRVSGFVFVTIFFLVPALILLWKSRRRLKGLEELYSFYHNLIMVKNITSIDEIARLSRQRRKMVVNDLKRMVGLGYLIGQVSEHQVYVHHRFERRSDYRTDYRTEVYNGSFEPKAAPVTPPPKPPVLMPKDVECPGCGSRSVVQPGATVVCDYCGTNLVYPTRAAKT